MDENKRTEIINLVIQKYIENDDYTEGLIE